jgi:uncharacterized protein (DUF486 family)
LPCQSPLLKPYHITTVADALQTLDVLAKNIGSNGSLVDRHIAAFIAAKIDIGREIRLSEYTNVPGLVENQELIMLWLLSKAQYKNQRMKLIEYCFQVPANRYGYGYFSAPQLKVIQEIITLSVFAVFSIFYLGEQIRWNHLVGFALIVVAAFFIFKKW